MGGGFSHWLLRLLPLLAFAGYFYFALIEPSTTPTKAITPEIEIDASRPITVSVPASGVAAPVASAPVPPPVAASKPALPSSMAALLRDWYARLATPPMRLWGLHPAGWLLLVLGTAALAYQFTRARAESLARLRTREVLREQHLHVPAPPTPRRTGPSRDDVREAARLLRRPQSVTTASPARPGAPLDVTATVRASASAGGRFVPVAKGQRVARRLVVLIDRARPGEPLALLMLRLTQALADEGVAVVTRHFDRDPRRALRPGAAPGDVLVLCSDGRGLLDARDGALMPWLAREMGQAWPLRVLLTPVPVASWGVAEDRLAGEGGFVVLPAVSWALPALARRVVSAQDGRAEAALELPFVHGAPARWPGLLRGQALRWLSPTPPAEEDVAALLRQLRGLLGARGFGWLAGCAAYPHLSLPLAEHLAVQWDDAEAKDDDARLREAQWLALAHLPWLRQGWMPEWLRKALLCELPVAQRERLGEALRALLKQEGTGGLDMGRIATAYLRRWFTGWLRWGESAGSPLRDVIYLGLLDGTIDKVLALDLDAKTAGRLRRKVEPAWRRPLLQGLAGVPVAAVMVWGVVLPYLRPAWVPSGQTTVAAARTPDMPAGTRFRDCKDDTCPWLRVIPAGNFMMGSPETEQGRKADEGPQHRVTIAKPFAVMETEVSVGMFKAFVADTRYQTSGGCYAWNGSKWELSTVRSWKTPFPDAEQDDRHAVVCVNWDDAQAFVKWMSQRTGQVYRLLTEFEWEYAARAGSKTRYSFGDNEADLCRHANVADQRAKRDIKGASDWTIAPCDDGFAYTAPVGNYQANAFDLRDMHGNAWEWTQDCWHDTYENSPTSGESWETNCKEERRVLRGGGWDNDPSIARAAYRNRNSPGYRINNTGFRLARTLTP